jgi:hypothetical protein
LTGKLRLWLDGTFTCIRCGRTLHIMTFGFGKSICPDSYRGEESFLFFDQRYWLNRIIARILNYMATPPEPTPLDSALLQHQYD